MSAEPARSGPRPIGMRFLWTILGVGFAATVALTGCGAHGSTPVASGGSHESAQSGCCVPYVDNVTGHLVTEGGPAGTPSMHWSGTITVQGPVHETVRTDTHGRFRLHLPDGTYQLTGRSPKYQSGRATCSAAGALVVHAGTPTTMDVVCQLM